MIIKFNKKIRREMGNNFYIAGYLENMLIKKYGNKFIEKIVNKWEKGFEEEDLFCFCDAYREEVYGQTWLETFMYFRWRIKK